MTISSETTRNDYTGNGVTTEFAYSFRIWSNTDLTVVTADDDGVESVLELTTDYTVTGAGQTTGGNVTLLTPLADGHKLTILSDIPALQGQKLSTQSGFSASVQEASLDKLTRVAQQLKEEVSRSIKFKPSIESSSITPTLPSPVPGAAIGWSESGDSLENIIGLGGISEAELAELIRSYSSLRGNAGTSYRFVSGFVRQSSAEAGWSIINTSTYSPTGIDSVSVNEDGDLVINYSSLGATRVSSFVAIPSDDFAGMGMRIGVTAGIDEAVISMSAPLSGPIVANTSSPLIPISGLGQNVTQTLSATKGSILIEHDPQIHTSSLGSAASVAPTRKQGRWEVSTTTSSVTLTYTRQLCGSVAYYSGSGLFEMEKTIAYPADSYIGSVTAGSSGKPRVNLLSSMGLETGHRVTITGVMNATEANVTNCLITKISDTSFDLEGVAYGGTPGIGGTCKMTKVCWNTDHIEVFNPYAGENVFTQLQKHKTASECVLTVDSDNMTTVGFHVYAYDMAGTQITSPSEAMRFNFTRDVFLPATVPASDIGVFSRDNVHCTADKVHSETGGIMVFGIFEAE